MCLSALCQRETFCGGEELQALLRNIAVVLMSLHLLEKRQAL
jgi:hypothetical protein